MTAAFIPSPNLFHNIPAPKADLTCMRSKRLLIAAAGTVALLLSVLLVVAVGTRSVDEVASADTSPSSVISEPASIEVLDSGLESSPELPETSSSTTQAPTTTVISATQSPNTQAPTTVTSTTQVPTTTVVSTTLAPTTTEVAGTQAPTTPAPTTQAPAPVALGTGFAGIEIADWTSSDAIVVSDGQPGSFRTVCTTSHFNYDDPIVFPGQQNATHLHMYFGNTLANYASTAESLASSGEGSCQGGPLNRTAYWVPAVFDQDGNVRPAQYMLTYYKRSGDEDIVPFPNGLKMVVGSAGAHEPQPGRERPVDAGIDYEWACGSPRTTGFYNEGLLIPDCEQGDFLTLALIFPRCSDGRLDSDDHRSHMAYPAYYGAECPASHPIRHPQLTYNIHWNNNDTNTAGWYLSSDDHRGNGGGILPGGTTTHADWFGAWHPEVLDIVTTGCFNATHDCKSGTMSPALRLNPPNIQGFSPSDIYDASVPAAIVGLDQFQ